MDAALRVLDHIIFDEFNYLKKSLKTPSCGPRAQLGVVESKQTVMRQAFFSLRLLLPLSTCLLTFILYPYLISSCQLYCAICHPWPW